MHGSEQTWPEVGGSVHASSQRRASYGLTMYSPGRAGGCDGQVTHCTAKKQKNVVG